MILGEDMKLGKEHLGRCRISGAHFGVDHTGGTVGKGSGLARRGTGSQSGGESGAGCIASARDIKDRTSKYGKQMIDFSLYGQSHAFCAKGYNVKFRSIAVENS